MEAQLYIPGHFKCPKCGFHLIVKNLNMNTATVTMKDSGDRPECPNCPGTVMDPWSWKSYAEEMEQNRDTWYKPMKRKYEVTQTVRLAILNGGTNFTALLIQLVAKADPFNLDRLKRAYPVEVAAYEA